MMQKLKTVGTVALMIGGVIFYFIVAYAILTDDEPRMIRYDCTIAEFHPDIPLEVREACRKIRHVTST
jgi:hypothetical protein